MILGFAHATWSTADLEASLRRFGELGLKPGARHDAKPSSAAKWVLTARQPRRHDLVLLTGHPVIELVCHDTGSVPGPSNIDLDLSLGEIIIRGQDVVAERAFFTAGLGCRQSEGAVLDCTGVVPHWCARIRIVAGSAANPGSPLDIEGFSCLAFYTSDPEGDCQRLLGLGGHDRTDGFGIEVGGRSLEIVMLRSPNGNIIELLKVIRK